MKLTALMTCLLLSASTIAQFTSDRVAVGVYYSPILPVSGMQQSISPGFLFPYGNEYYADFNVLPSYSQAIGFKLTMPASDAFHVNAGIVFSNRQHHFEQEIPEDDYYYNSPYDTLFNVKAGGNFAELHAELKQALYQPGRFSIFYSFGAAFGLLLKETVRLDARPYEGPEIRNYKKEVTESSVGKIMFHAGVGFDFELSEYLFLTVQPQYVFYFPGEFDPYVYTPHTGRINIGINYYL